MPTLVFVFLLLLVIIIYVTRCLSPTGLCGCRRRPMNVCYINMMLLKAFFPFNIYAVEQFKMLAACHLQRCHFKYLILSTSLHIIAFSLVLFIFCLCFVGSCAGRVSLEGICALRNCQRNENKTRTRDHFH